MGRLLRLEAEPEAARAVPPQRLIATAAEGGRTDVVLSRP